MTRMVFACAVAGVLFTCVGCHAKVEDEPATLDAGASDAPTDAGDAAAEAAPYPTDSIGTHARRDPIRGERIANVRLRGFGDSDLAAGLREIALGELYDPTARRAKVIVVVLTATWEPLGRQVLKEMAPSFANGTAAAFVGLGRDANEAELRDLVTATGAKMHAGLDPQHAALGLYWDPAALPAGIYVDARTMEILEIGPLEAATLARWGEWVRTRPPSY